MKPLVVFIACIMSLGFAGPAHADGPIKIAINEWTGQALSAHIAGAMFQEMGYDVDYVTAGAVPQFAALADGNLHVNPETWSNNVGDIFPKAVASGDLLIVGELGLDPKEGWFYPPYMEDICPGLPRYQALYDCARAFAAADTFPKGRLITYPADWGTRSADLVDAIDLPFQPVAGGSEGAMIAEMKAAVATKQPMLMMFWQPHWIHAEIDLNLVSWDHYSEACESGPQVKGYACGFAQAKVQKLAYKGFPDAYPDAFEAYQKMSLTNETQNALIAQVDNEGMSVEDAVAGWMASNQAIWQAWIR